MEQELIVTPKPREKRKAIELLSDEEIHDFRQNVFDALKQKLEQFSIQDDMEEHYRKTNWESKDRAILGISDKTGKNNIDLFFTALKEENELTSFCLSVIDRKSQRKDRIAFFKGSHVIVIESENEHNISPLDTLKKDEFEDVINLIKDYK